MTPRERAGRVLLVEDSEGGAQLMRIAFSERLPDARLEIFADGERALAALDAGNLSQWDLVLLDLRLPGVGGHEVLAAVRASSDERVRRMPVVVLSHSEVVEDVLRSYELGANSHIAKPHSLDALFEVVETVGRYWLNVVSLPN
ncbi:MAG TPA: response regulator [Solirubrobacteraceae bacterium]|nr:response regulator [Solirubrobacteraceae bacterium]